MKKIYLLICAVLLAQGAMAIDYEQLKKNSKINAMSKIELAKLQTLEEKAVAQSKATGSKLRRSKNKWTIARCVPSSR